MISEVVKRITPYTYEETSEDSSQSNDTEIVIWEEQAVEAVTDRLQAVSIGQIPKLATQSLSAIPQMTPRHSREYMKRRVSETAESPRVVLEMKVAEIPQGVNGKNIADKQAALFEELIKKVPQHAVSLKRFVGKLPEYTLYNNYGITPDAHTSIVIEDKHVLFQINKEHKRIPCDSCYTDGSQIFITEKQAILADTVAISKSEKGYRCFVVADGCSWGERPKNAAHLAARFAMMLLEQRLEKRSECTTQKIAKNMLKILTQVQNELVLKGDMVSETTITLACIADTHLVLASVGDSKVFVLRKTSNGKLKSVDITEGSRRASHDASDPGGRLGGKYADWRNLAVAVVKLEPNDIIIGCSDGIHDNFDPVHLGCIPKDFGYQEDEWDAQKRHLVHLRQEILNKNLVAVVEKDIANIGRAFVSYVSNLTLKGKLFMLENPTARRPNNYKEYPGKDDHVSVVVFTYDPAKKLRGSFFIRK